jgi:hypothetical protein
MRDAASSGVVMPALRCRMGSDGTSRVPWGRRPREGRLRTGEGGRIQ